MPVRKTTLAPAYCPRHPFLASSPPVRRDRELRGPAAGSRRVSQRGSPYLLLRRVLHRRQAAWCADLHTAQLGLPPATFLPASHLDGPVSTAQSRCDPPQSAGL